MRLMVFGVDASQRIDHDEKESDTPAAARFKRHEQTAGSDLCIEKTDRLTGRNVFIQYLGVEKRKFTEYGLFAQMSGKVERLNQF